MDNLSKQTNKTLGYDIKICTHKKKSFKVFLLNTINFPPKS